MYHIYDIVFYEYNLLSSSRGPCRWPVHHGASVGPGRASWRVLWVFEVAKSAKLATGSHSTELEPTRPMETKKIHISLLCALLCARYLPQVYHTMVQPQTLYTLTQPRHNISRPSSFCLCETSINRASGCVCHPRILQQAVHGDYSSITTECGSI